MLQSNFGLFLFVGNRSRKDGTGVPAACYGSGGGCGLNSAKKSVSHERIRGWRACRTRPRGFSFAQLTSAVAPSSQLDQESLAMNVCEYLEFGAESRVEVPAQSTLEPLTVASGNLGDLFRIAIPHPFENLRDCVLHSVKRSQMSSNK